MVKGLMGRPKGIPAKKETKERIRKAIKAIWKKQKLELKKKKETELKEELK
jgi:hypothetical protein